MLTSLGQALTQQTWKKYIIYKSKQHKWYLTKIDYSRLLIKNQNALNVYRIYLYQNLNFMHRINIGNIPSSFSWNNKKAKA